jgi:type II secretion system protein J
MGPELRNSGFTLVEVVVASMIGAFIALVAVGTLKSIAASAEVIDDSVYVAAEVRFASNMVATDLMNLYRDQDVQGMKFVGVIEGSGDNMASCLTFYTVGRVKARADQPEGDVYEVEYYLSRKGERSALMRRLWPNPDKEAEPGGMLTAIAEDIDIFEVMFFDGKDWYSEWPEKMGSIPQLVEVNIAASQSRGGQKAGETFIVNFARSGWGEYDDEEVETEEGERQ